MTASVDERVVEWSARLSLEEKVGQLLVARSTKTDAAAFVERFAVGGYIVDRSVYENPSQMTDHIDGLHRAAQGRSLLPLFIACDQEGGHTAFMRRGATEVPSNMGLGATHDPATAREAASILATELRAVGVNWDFAPCVDVNRHPENPVIGVRSYGDDPSAVAAFGAAAVRGFQENGILACAKHFPGHGDTDLDSHVALPTVAHDRGRLDEVELPPFRAAIAAGVASVMTAHIRVPALDPERIGTLSSAILTDLLRGEMGYGGIVVTDAMDMAGVSEHWDDGEAAVETVRAGADVILTRRGLERNERIQAALLDAVRSGRIPSTRFEDALGRILRAKASLPATVGPHRTALVGSDAHRDRALALARQTISLVRDDAGAIPLARDAGGRLLVISPRGTSRTMMETWTAAECPLGPEVIAMFPGATDIQVDFPLGTEKRAGVILAAKRAAMVVVGTLNAVLDPDQVALLEALRNETSARIVVVALRMPYDLIRVPWVETYLCAYTTALPSMTATAEVLAGDRVATGRLPVGLGGLYPRGHRAS